MDHNCFLATQPPLIIAPHSFQRMTSHLGVLGSTENRGARCIPININIKAVECIPCANQYHGFTHSVLTNPHEWVSPFVEEARLGKND